MPELLSKKITFDYVFCCRHLRPPLSPAVYPFRPPTFPTVEFPSQATFLLAVTVFPAFLLGEACRAVTDSHAPSSPSPVFAYPTCQIYLESEQNAYSQAGRVIINPTYPAAMSVPGIS